MHYLTFLHTVPDICRRPFGVHCKPFLCASGSKQRTQPILLSAVF